VAAAPPFAGKWDVHTHTTLAPETFDALARFSHYEHFVRVQQRAGAGDCAQLMDCSGRVLRNLQPNAYRAHHRLAECDAHGVTMQVISPTPMMLPDSIESAADAAEICRILNDGNAALAAEHPARFTALAALPMNFADEALREMERVRALGMHGFEINTNVHGLDLDDPRFFPIFAAAAELGMAVFVHPWSGFMAPAEERLRARMREGRNWRPWLLAMGMETALAFDSMRCGAVHERLPQLRVLYAHGGGAFPAMLGRMEHGPYSRPDFFRDASKMTPYETVRQCAVYADSLTHDPWALQLLLHQLGVERVAMGSDYPYPLGEIDPFDAATSCNPQGDAVPYAARKGIYPGHMIEHLPEEESDAAIEAAWEAFHWLPRQMPSGERRLPVLTRQEKQRMLAETAKEWLGWS
jgi:aminocarboxymuconate-semialdehyde decarboxylase